MEWYTESVTKMSCETQCNFRASDVEDWMWDRAATRAGHWTITVPFRTSWRTDGVKHRRVNLSQHEFAMLDKVVANQVYSESKDKVYRAVVYQRSLQLWDSGNDDDVTMRTLGAWAVSMYKCQGNKFETSGWFPSWLCPKRKHRVRLTLTGTSRRSGPPGLPPPLPGPPGPGNGGHPGFPHGGGFSPRRETLPEPTGGAASLAPGSSTTANTGGAPSTATPQTCTRNALGYQAAGAEYVNEHECGGNDEADSEIRANVRGRLIQKDAGIGVVGQSLNDKNRKQIVGVLSLPTSCEPNVYAQEAMNAIKAIEERVKKKQRPYAGTKADEHKIKRMVYQSMFGKKNAPFSAKKVLDLIHEAVYKEIKSKKWTEQRVQDAIEKLCREIDPEFKLKGAIKLEGMPEGKAPRFLIADEDVGQVMALMTIWCMGTLIKRHFPEKGIKGLPKKEAVKRVMKACRAPKKVAKKLVSIFEGDGRAWDTTCGSHIRDLVENPVINHIANLVNGFLHASPDVWQEAHCTVNAQEKLDITYSKNKEYQKIVIDAIRRSGHRGTSDCNWWVNFVLWHCAIFEEPEAFLDPSHRYGKDITGVYRWLTSAFEGDDSFLSTSPPIEPGTPLHVGILQFWERVGFNMSIEIRKDRALFVGYYIGIDGAGPVFDEAKDEWMMVPEIDRCFGRAGISCSPDMVQAFKEDRRDKCLKLAGTAAMSRAYEFAGLCPTISDKFLTYALEADFEINHDLKMRTGEAFDDKSELVDYIRAANGLCQCEDKILLATGFYASPEEKNKFTDWIWHYDILHWWKSFKETLPQTWRV